MLLPLCNGMGNKNTKMIGTCFFLWTTCASESCAPYYCNPVHGAQLLPIAKLAAACFLSQASILQGIRKALAIAPSPHMPEQNDMMLNWSMLASLMKQVRQKAISKFKSILLPPTLVLHMRPTQRLCLMMCGRGLTMTSSMYRFVHTCLPSNYY